MRSAKTRPTLAKLLSNRLMQKWGLSQQHRLLLESAILLFGAGMTSVPLCISRMRSLISLLENPEELLEAFSHLDEEHPLSWPPAWSDSLDTQSPFVITTLEKTPYLYPREVLSSECLISSLLTSLFQRTSSLQNNHSSTSDFHAHLREAQRHALHCSLSLPFTVITGGPGTGKTFTAACIIQAHQTTQLAQNRYCRVIVAAPTGKAAVELQRRLSSTVLQEAKLQEASLQEEVVCTTLHRLLKISPFHNPRSTPLFLDASLLIIDECSMIDMNLFSLLLSKIHPMTKVVLIGDPNQLPPIGSGDVFASLCRYAKDVSFPGFVQLEESVRFETQTLSQLASLCLTQDPSFLKDISLHKLHTSLNVKKPLETIHQLYTRWQRDTTLLAATTPIEALTTLSSVIILCSLQEGPWGVKAINRYFLTKALQERCHFIPILFTENNDALYLQNGLLGILEIVPGQESREMPHGMLYYSTPAGVRTLPSDLVPFQLAYAISVHKSQGSEFHHVSLLLSPGSEQFGKSLLYTALTRARKTLHFFSLEETLLQTLCFPSGNLSHLYDRMRSQHKS